MNATVTITLDEKHHEKLRRRARAERKSESEVAEELVLSKLDEEAPYTWDDIKHLAGCVKLPKHSTDPWIEHMRRTNWRT